MAKTWMMAIDPGTTKSAWVELSYPGGNLLAFALERNEDVLAHFLGNKDQSQMILAVEKIEAMGMAVGAEVFETVYWSGRFAQAYDYPDTVIRVPRRAVKLHLCGTMKAKDANIRQALIDRFGPPGTKKDPGQLYGVSKDVWAALAVGVTAIDTMCKSG